MRSAFPLMCMNPFSCNFSVANDEGGPCRPASPSRRLVVFSFCPLQTEGIALAQAADLPADKLLTVLDQGAMSNPMFRMKVRPKIRRKKAPPPWPSRARVRRHSHAAGLLRFHANVLSYTARIIVSS